MVLTWIAGWHAQSTRPELSIAVGSPNGLRSLAYLSPGSDLDDPAQPSNQLLDPDFEKLGVGHVRSQPFDDPRLCSVLITVSST